MVARHVNMSNLNKSQRSATPKHAHKCALVRLARGVNVTLIALVAPSLAPSRSSVMVQLLHALMQLEMWTQLNATHTTAQTVMFALR